MSKKVGLYKWVKGPLKLKALQGIDYDFCDGVAGGQDHKSQHRPINELWHVLNNAQALISFDAGPIHFAGTTDTHIIQIGASIDPRKTAPYRKGRQDYKFKFGYSVSSFPFIKAVMASFGQFKKLKLQENFVSYFSSTVFDKSFIVFSFKVSDVVILCPSKPASIAFAISGLSNNSCSCGANSGPNPAANKPKSSNPIASSCSICDLYISAKANLSAKFLAISSAVISVTSGSASKL